MSKKHFKKRVAEKHESNMDLCRQLPGFDPGDKTNSKREEDTEEGPGKFFWNEADDEIFSSPGL